MHLSLSLYRRWPCDRSTVRCACLCVCESSELLKSTEPRGENLLVGIFENAFKWMKLFPLFPAASSLPSLPCLELAPAVWRLCGRVSRCKLNEACDSFSRSHAYFLARTSTEWAAEGAWQLQPLWSGKAVWAFVLHLFSATFAFDMHRLKQAASATAAKASPSTASQLQIRRGNLCVIFGTLPSQLLSPPPPPLLATPFSHNWNRNKVVLVICSDDFVHVREMK